jgi:hypothetical protein
MADEEWETLDQEWRRRAVKRVKTTLIIFALCVIGIYLFFATH